MSPRFPPLRRIEYRNYHLSLSPFLCYPPRHYQLGEHIRAPHPSEVEEEALMDLTSVMVGQDGHSSLVLPSEHGFALQGKPMVSRVDDSHQNSHF